MLILHGCENLRGKVNCVGGFGGAKVPYTGPPQCARHKRIPCDRSVERPWRHVEPDVHGGRVTANSLLSLSDRPPPSVDPSPGSLPGSTLSLGLTSLCISAVDIPYIDPLFSPVPRHTVKARTTGARRTSEYFPETLADV